MAETSLNSFNAGLDIHSARTKPAERVNLKAIAVMKKLGIDL